MREEKGASEEEGRWRKERKKEKEREEGQRGYKGRRKSKWGRGRKVRKREEKVLRDGGRSTRNLAGAVSASISCNRVYT